jgi:predicted amidophosphoribosyltransferase
MAKINPQKIAGKWRAGIALDAHTVSSAYLGVDEAGRDRFETKRSEMGDLLYRLKYKGDAAAGQEIVNTAATYLKPARAKFDLIVTVPPSRARATQPVTTLANGIGAATNLPVVQCVTRTRSAEQLKDITDPAKRQEALAGLHAVDVSQTEGKNILLLDDLYRSGATLNAITELLLKEGKAKSVCVLTMTRTRSNQ